MIDDGGAEGGSDGVGSWRLDGALRDHIVSPL